QITLFDFNQKPDFDKTLADLQRQFQEAQLQFETIREPGRKNFASVVDVINRHRVVDRQENPPKLNVDFDGSSVKPLVDALTREKGHAITLYIGTSYFDIQSPNTADLDIGRIISSDDDVINDLNRLTLLPIQPHEIDKALSRRNLIGEAISVVNR